MCDQNLFNTTALCFHTHASSLLSTVFVLLSLSLYPFISRTLFQYSSTHTTHSSECSTALFALCFFLHHQNFPVRCSAPDYFDCSRYSSSSVRLFVCTCTTVLSCSISSLPSYRPTHTRPLPLHPSFLMYTNNANPFYCLIGSKPFSSLSSKLSSHFFM